MDGARGSEELIPEIIGVDFEISFQAFVMYHLNITGLDYSGRAQDGVSEGW